MNELIKPSRRGLIVGLGSLLVAPALVRVDSLMPLRGYNMDPLVLAFDVGGEPLVGHPVWYYSEGNAKGWTIADALRHYPQWYYSRVSLSDVDPWSRP